jgi:hypothetical protein
MRTSENAYLLGSRVNKGKKKGRGYCYAPARSACKRDVAFRYALPTGARLEPRRYARIIGVISDPATTEIFGLCWERTLLASPTAAVPAFVVGVLGGSEHRHSASDHHRHGYQSRYQEEYHPPPGSLHNHTRFSFLPASAAHLAGPNLS